MSTLPFGCFVQTYTDYTIPRKRPVILARDDKYSWVVLNGYDEAWFMDYESAEACAVYTAKIYMVPVLFDLDYWDKL